MERLRNIFATRRKALVIFDSCGSPDLEESERRLESIIANGADIVELGVPFSDPMADGPVIQRASLAALRHGVTLRDVIAVAYAIRTAGKLNKDAVMLVNLSGRGDKDMENVRRYTNRENF